MSRVADVLNKDGENPEDREEGDPDNSNIWVAPFGKVRIAHVRGYRYRLG